ncbi:hypothetical protein [Candidatus Liberibacter solanacearum]|nr:hypothetical protein [Candidatus Liberibacter solanacearum]
MKIFKNKLKIHFFNKLLFFSKKGNFAMISAIMIPSLALLLGIVLVTSNYLLHKYSVESASEEALSHGMSLICYQNDIERDNLAKIILNDLIVSLKKNNFTKQEADLVAKNSKIDITTLINDSTNVKSYHFYIKSVYKMPLNKITKIFYPKDLTIVTNVNKIVPCPYTSYVMLSNPRARQFNSDWDLIHRRTVNAINSIITDKNIKYMIINGSMTNFDPSHYYTAEVKQFNNVYRHLNVPIFRSIGTRDYVDNNGICRDGDVLTNFSTYSCAFAALNDLSWRIINEYKYKLPEINYDVKRWIDYCFFQTIHHIRGSLAYTWNDKNIHFVQLNNSLFYSSHFYPITHEFDCEIEPTMHPGELTASWLEQDLRKARKENKTIILFVDQLHDFYSSSQLQAFKDLLIRHKIAAVFSGLEPGKEEEFVYDNNNHVTKFYNTGVAIPRYGHFMLLENRGHSLDVLIYNTSNRIATLAKKMSSITLPH